MGVLQFVGVVSSCVLLCVVSIVYFGHSSYYNGWSWRVFLLSSSAFAVGSSGLTFLIGRELLHAWLWLASLYVSRIAMPALGYLRKSNTVDAAFVTSFWALNFIPFYLCVLLDGLLRTLLSHLHGTHPGTGTHLSLVNAPDSCFMAPAAEQVMSRYATEPSHVDNGVFRECAVVLSVAAKLAYEAPPIVQYETAQWGFSRCEHVGDPLSSAHGFVAIGESVVLVSFSGTSPLNLKHWAHDLNRIPSHTNTEMGAVHTGFGRAMGIVPPPPRLSRSRYRSVIRRSLAVVKRLCAVLLGFQSAAWDLQGIGGPLLRQVEGSIAGEVAKGKRVFITGHSLGGALAQIFAAHLVLTQPHIAESVAALFLYGAPRCGDEEHCSFLDSRLPNRIHRFVNHMDIVPRVPFNMPRIVQSLSEPLLFTRAPRQYRYADAGQLHVLDPTGALHCDFLALPASRRLWTQLTLVGVLNSHTLHRLRSESWARISLRLLLPFFINDHFPSDYVNMLRISLVQQQELRGNALPCLPLYGIMPLSRDLLQSRSESMIAKLTDAGRGVNVSLNMRLPYPPPDSCAWRLCVISDPQHMYGILS